MLSFANRQEFTKSIIAQDDDEDYQESGYVVCRQGNDCGIARYSHCSCYGTWTSLADNPPFFVWEGSYADLLDLAMRGADPSMPLRQASSKDCDYDRLMAVYKQILDSIAFTLTAAP